MLDSVLVPIARHAFQAWGTWLVSIGWINGDDVNLVVGAGLSLLAVVWAVCKRKGFNFCQY